MAIFRSPEVLINKNAQDLFEKIEDLNNLKDIMPSQIEGFKSNKDSCSFKINGMPKLKLEITEKIPFKKISLVAKESQVPLLLTCYIKDRGNQCQVILEINAELNMMMRMMIEKPLKEFLDVLSNKMQKI